MASELTLFDNFERTDHRDDARRGTLFAFMNRSAWPACENVRGVLEQWFARYPDDAKNELLSRFRKHDDNHASAFFELVLHETFSQLGLAPVVHPETPSGRSRPDFAISAASGAKCYVEANVAAAGGFMGTDPNEDVVLDAIDALAMERSTAIHVSARSSGTLLTTPSIRRITNQVRRWLDEVDSECPLPGKIDPQRSLRLSHEGWSLTLTAYWCSENLPDGLIANGPVKSGVSTAGADLRKNLIEKAKQHGRLDRPLIIAMNTMSGSQDTEDEMAALFGTEQLIWEEDAAGNAVTPPRLAREPDSLWRNRSGNRYSRVHGVLFFRGVRPWNMHNVVSHLYVNPYIDADIPDELLHLGSARVRDGKMTWERGTPLGELLDLPDDWPGERTRPTYN